MTTQPSDLAVAPKFGERLRGIYASERNPYRDGMYVRTIRRTGRCNPGTYFELTDGKGNFWQYPRDSVIRLDRARELDTSGGGCGVSPEVVGSFVEKAAQIISGAPFPSGRSLYKARQISDLALSMYAAPRAAEAGDKVSIDPSAAEFAVTVAEEWKAMFSEITGLEKYDRFTYGPAVDDLIDELRAAMGAVGAGD